MILNYKYKLYVNRHTKDLSQLVTTANCVWNHIIALYRRYYKLYKRIIPCGKLQKHIAKLAKRNKYWSKMGSQSLQEICQRADRAYTLFLKRVHKGRPNFHKIDKSGSFTFKGSNGYHINGNEITIRKIKRTYKFKLTRQYGTIINIHIKRDNIGCLWLIITTDVNQKQFKRLGNASIGMDFGLKHFFTLSNGKVIDCPRPYKTSLQTIKRLNRSVDLKKKGSNGRKRALKKLARLNYKAANIRHDFQWKLAHELCKQNKFIAIEDLNLSGLHKRYGRKMKDLGLGEFIIKLQYISSKYGTVIKKIDRLYASSQICNNCGYKNKDVKNLSLRMWKCPICGKTHDRDINAALNILKKANGEGVPHDRSNVRHY